VATDPSFKEGKVKFATLTGTVSEEDGVIVNNQPVHYVALKTEPKKMYEIKLTGAPNQPTPNLQLQSLEGELIRNGQFGGPGNTQFINFPSLAAGNYRIAVLGYQNQKIGYTLTIGEADYTPPKVQVTKMTTPKFEETAVKVATVTGTITEEDGINASNQPYHLVTLKVAPGKMYDLKMTYQGGGGGFVPQLRLEGLKGEVIKYGQSTGGNTATLSYSATKADEYRVALIGVLGQTIPYTLTITEKEFVAPKITVTKLTVTADKPAVHAGQITNADPRGDIDKFHKVYTFEGKAGKTYQIDLHSNAFDAYLYLKDSTDLTLMENDDNGESLDSRIIWTVKKDGTYKILATSLGGNGVGPYDLTVRELKAPPKKD
jgi:hypothetical protein